LRLTLSEITDERLKRLLATSRKRGRGQIGSSILNSSPSESELQQAAKAARKEKSKHKKHKSKKDKKDKKDKLKSSRKKQRNSDSDSSD
jgi:hypothetical protein